MAAIQIYVFGLLFCIFGYFLKEVNATDRITNMENKFEILDQKFTLQTLELSQVKQELAVEKTSRMLLEIKLNSLIDSLGNNKMPLERIRDNKFITASNRTRRIDKADLDHVKQLFKDVVAVKNKTIDVLNEIDLFKKVQHNLTERLENTVGEIKEKLKAQDIKLNQTIHAAKTDKTKWQSSLHAQQRDIESLKLESIDAKKNSDIFSATLSELVKENNKRKLQQNDANFIP